MKIIDKTERKPEQFVKNLKVGTLYRLIDPNYDTDIVYMSVVFSTKPHQISNRRASVVLNTGAVILWNGHEEMGCVEVDAELIIKGELK